MDTKTSGYVRCALCGADNPEAAAECHACHGELPDHRRRWSQPAFERVLLASSLSSAQASSSSEEGVAGRPGRLSVWSWLGASGETIRAVLLEPDRAFRFFRLEGGFAAPIAFVTAVGGAALFLHLLLSSPFEDAASLRWWQIPLFFLAPAVYVYLRAQVVHLVLVFGGHAREAFEVTFRVVAYGSASAALLLLVPVVGEFLFLLAGVWIESTGLRRCHSISLEAALVAEVVPAAVLVLTVLAAVTLRVLWWSQLAA